MRRGVRPSSICGSLREILELEALIPGDSAELGVAEVSRRTAAGQPNDLRRLPFAAHATSGSHIALPGNPEAQVPFVLE